MIRTLTNLAQVAKLVDALASGASGGNSVEVQVLSWAPLLYSKIVISITWANKTLLSRNNLDTLGVLELQRFS